MRNASHSDRRPPGRVPRRGLAALTLTATAMALMFSFKTPSEMFAGKTDAVAIGLGGVTTADSALQSMPPATEPREPRHPATEPATLPPATEPATLPPVTEPATLPPVTEPATPSVVAGQTVTTPFGPVQVEITLDASEVIDVQALQLPAHRSYSARISRYVEPILRDEALQAQSARIDLISGATYTSTGYAMSLQSALDQARASSNAPA